MLPQICRINWGNRQIYCPCSAANLSAARPQPWPTPAPSSSPPPSIAPGASSERTGSGPCWHLAAAGECGGDEPCAPGSWQRVATAGEQGGSEPRAAPGSGRQRPCQCGPDSAGGLEIWGAKLGPCWALRLILSNKKKAQFPLPSRTGHLLLRYSVLAARSRSVPCRLVPAERPLLGSRS
jgi:hypothetical protein